MCPQARLSSRQRANGCATARLELRAPSTWPSVFLLFRPTLCIGMLEFRGPQRIVCLTEETTETLYLLGEDRRIVGISGFTCRPKEAREKPKVSAFTSAKIDKILELHPDLVL